MGEGLTACSLGLGSRDLRDHDSELKDAQGTPSSLSKRALPSPNTASNLLRIHVTFPPPSLEASPKDAAASLLSPPSCATPSPPIRRLSPFSRKSIHQSNLSVLPSASYPLSHGSHGNRRGWPGRQGCLATGVSGLCLWVTGGYARRAAGVGREGEEKTGDEVEPFDPQSPLLQSLLLCGQKRRLLSQKGGRRKDKSSKVSPVPSDLCPSTVPPDGLSVPPLSMFLESENCVLGRVRVVMGNLWLTTNLGSFGEAARSPTAVRRVRVRLETGLATERRQ